MPWYMTTWQTKGNLREQLEAKPEVTAQLSKSELDQIFDLDSYFKNLGEIFERVLSTEWAR